MRNRKKDKRESGQALVEFALVLPILLILVMGIIDFGWLFFNYITFENCARNAARAACVECDECCVTTNDEGKKIATFGKVFDPKIMANNDDTDLYTEQERYIVDTALKEMPANINVESVQITFSYDDKMKDSMWKYELSDRTQGDVTVTVKGKMHVLTPVLGVFSDNMQKEIVAHSTYKVEPKSPNDGDYDD